MAANVPDSGPTPYSARPLLEDPDSVGQWYRDVARLIEEQDRPPAPASDEGSATRRHGPHRQRLTSRSLRRRPAVHAEFGETFFGAAHPAPGFAAVKGAPDKGGAVLLGADAGGLVAIYRAAAGDDEEVIRDRVWVAQRLAGSGAEPLLDLLAEPDHHGRRRPEPRALARSFAYWALRSVLGPRAIARLILAWDAEVANTQVRRGLAAENAVISECERHRDRLGRFDPT